MTQARITSAIPVHFARAARFVTVWLWMTSLGISASAAAERPISFVNDVLPVLTKSGCNVGVCHAKAGNGQNGFRLSLLGFEPDEDVDYLTRESRGRRLSPSSPTPACC